MSCRCSEVPDPNKNETILKTLRLWRDRCLPFYVLYFKEIDTLIREVEKPDVSLEERVAILERKLNQK